MHEEMSYLKMGPGPYFSLYRPYHLASIEAPLSIAEAVLTGGQHRTDRLERRGRRRRQAGAQGRATPSTASAAPPSTG